MKRIRAHAAGDSTHRNTYFPESHAPLFATMEQSAENETDKPLTVKQVID